MLWEVCVIDVGVELQYCPCGYWRGFRRALCLRCEMVVLDLGSLCLLHLLSSSSSTVPSGRCRLWNLRARERSVDSILACTILFLDRGEYGIVGKVVCGIWCLCCTGLLRW